ncbi:nucleoporin SEH1-A-like isoform X2 [Myzus persicae]|uniref:nucleoporin SEH1-A-like isoform X2 n=1 Tax=Myzus persicae TaxID=13164 RepID=UPI000B937B1A|nr:nucleoporin SEH1-A-like isoform X2 [Myzus persicae]
MVEAHSINSEHKDLIHDVAFDYYGDRMATCSTDNFVKVWDQDVDGNWNLSSSWKAHSGSVWKVTWAHPDFGQVLATCSFDRTAAIWEEILGESDENGTVLRHWVHRANLVDSVTSVTDVKFGPKSFGFNLATCSADGVLRIYEAPDAMNIAEWPLQHEVSLKLPSSCLTWNPLLSTNPIGMIAVGSDDNSNTTNSKVFICEYNKVSRRWAKTKSVTSVEHPVHDMIFAPNMGRSFYLLAIATNNVRILKLRPIVGAARDFPYTIETAAQFNDHLSTVWRVAWNITGTVLASSGDDGCVRLWKLDIWNCVGVLKRDGKLPQPQSKNSQSTAQNNLTRFIKLGQITHPSEVHWH